MTSCSRLAALGRSAVTVGISGVAVALATLSNGAAVACRAAPRAIASAKALEKEWGVIAFVQFVHVADAQRAIAELNQKEAPDGSWIQVSIKQTKSKGEGKGKQ